MLIVSGRISMKIAESINPAPRATRYLRKRSPNRCAPDLISSSPPTRFASAASVPNRSSPANPPRMSSIQLRFNLALLTGQRGAQLYLMNSELAISLRQWQTFGEQDKSRFGSVSGGNGKKLCFLMFFFLTAEGHQRTIARVGWSKVVGSGSNLVAK